MDYIQQLIEFAKYWLSYFGLIGDQNLEDGFYQLLLDKKYDDALKLAQQHKYLDMDLVYVCKWRKSGMTVQSINNVLAKIKDKLWVINECTQIVPNSYDACKTLIDFGLKEANLRLLYQLGNESSSTDSCPPDSYNKLKGKVLRNLSRNKELNQEKQPLLAEDLSEDEIEGLIDFDNLNDRQKELCSCRQDLLRNKHSLTTYESILGDYKTVQQHFDRDFYDEFRKKCPLNVCIDYAHEGDAHAVEILLNFYTDDLTPHYLAILSQFPETLSPYYYRNLLPCLREGEETYEWRSLSGQMREEVDWSNQADISTSLSISLKSIGETYVRQFYETEPTLRKYLKPFTATLLSQWFIERAIEIESRTLLLSSAIQLLNLGSELNIKNLTKTHDDLVEFDRIVFDCCSENNIYLSFTEFNKITQLEQLVLLTGESVKNCKDRFRFYVIPFIHRRETKLGFEGKADTLRHYFRQLAHTREHLCRLIYNDLLDKIECDEFVAEWTRDLDDIIDEIGVEIKKIEQDRQAKQLSTMASQTMALGDYNECYEACQLIMKKDHRSCWALCCQLGMHKQFTNVEAKYKLLAFALAHCDDQDGKMSAKILDYIIELRKRDEKIQRAYLERNSL